MSERDKEREKQAHATVKDDFVCPHRDTAFDKVSNYPTKDRWVPHKNGIDRTCSYCGGIHPDDFVPILKASCDPVDETYISPSDKPWKIYLSRPGIKNADDGAIKTYGGHGLPTGFTYEEFLALLKEAQKASRPKIELTIQRVADHLERQERAEIENEVPPEEDPDDEGEEWKRGQDGQS